MAEINLLKDELQKTKLGLRRQSLISLYIALAIFVLEIGVYGFMLFQERRYGKQGLEVAQSGAATDFEIGKLEKSRQEAVSFQARLANLDVLLKEHVFWSQLLAELGKYTYKPIVYRTMQVDQAKRKLILSGISPTYTDLGKLILGLRQSPNFSDISFSSSGATEEKQAGYGFQLDISFDPKLLLK